MTFNVLENNSDEFEFLKHDFAVPTVATFSDNLIIYSIYYVPTIV